MKNSPYHKDETIAERVAIATSAMAYTASICWLHFDLSFSEIFSKCWPSFLTLHIVFAFSGYRQKKKKFPNGPCNRR